MPDLSDAGSVHGHSLSVPPAVLRVADTLRAGHTPTCAPAELTAALRYLSDKARADAWHRARQEEAAERFKSALRPSIQPTLLTVPTAGRRGVVPAQHDQSNTATFERAPIIQAAVNSTITALQQAAKPHVHQAQIESALALAEYRITTQIRPRARHRARLVYHALVEATYTLMHARQHNAQVTTSYCWFTVLDVLPLATKLSTATCERATHDLREIGLLATWSDWATAEFLNRETGEVFETRARTGVWVCVLLKPREGLRARIHPAELPRDDQGQLLSQRDLNADRKAGHTAHQLKQEVRESITHHVGKVNIQSLLYWSLPKTNLKSLVTRDSLTSQPMTNLAEFMVKAGPRELVEVLSALRTEVPQRRRDAVQAAGTALARVFNDQQSVRHYYRVLWRALQADLQGLRGLDTLQTEMRRVLIDMKELPIAHPGALLTSRLKESDWWNAVYRSHPAA